MALSALQEKFVEEYIKCRKGAEAARRAGYSTRTARTIAAENLTKPDILAEIERRTKESHIELDEVLGRLADIARGSMEDFTSFTYYPYPDAIIDLGKAEERNVLHLIKKIKYDKDGKLELELYSALDANKALAQLLSAGPKGSEGDPLHIKFIEGVSENDR